MQHNEIKGFTDQSERSKGLVNANKEAEERILRTIDELGQMPNVNQDELAWGRMLLLDAFMWINRSIFRPQRVKLPEDEPLAEPPPPLPPVHVGQVFRSLDEKNDKEIVKDEQGNELVAVGPHWYRKAEADKYETEYDQYLQRQAAKAQ